MDQVLTVVAVGLLYREAEEEAAQLRKRIRQRRARMQRRSRSRRAILAHLSTLDQSPLHRYAVVNSHVPVLQRFFSGADMKPALRLSRESLRLLMEMLPHEKTHGWKHELEVLVTLYWLACGASYRVTADSFSMPLSTVCRVVHNLVEKMMTILHQVIHFPKPEEMEEVGAGFACLAGHEAFRQAAGAIDGCHIRVRPPAEPQKKCYFNRKLFPSIVLQGICDSKGTLLDVYIGNPGSVHDALVLRRSPMYRQALYPPAGYFLLGDGGYPCLHHPVAIMTPFRQPIASQVEARYNRHHARGRNIIERTFGILKTRWRSIFLRALEVRPLFAPKVIAACCILHNICTAAGDVLEEHGEDEEEGGAPVPDDGEDDGDDVNIEERALSGNGVRRRLAAQISAPEALPEFLGEHDYI